MKRLLLVTTALAGTSLFAAQAFAESAQVGPHTTNLKSDKSVSGGLDVFYSSSGGSFSHRAGAGNGSYEGRNSAPTNSRYIDEAGDRESPIIQQEPAFAVKLAGTVRFDLQYTDQDHDLQSGRSDFNMFDSRRDFSVFGTASSANGLTYGFEIDVGTHRAEMFLLSDYGRLSMGDTFSATEALDVGGRSVMVGFGHYALGGNKGVNTGTIQGAGVTSYRGQGATIRYTSPNYNGLTISGSYTRESDTDMRTFSGAGTSKDIFGVAGQYTTQYGNYTAVLYGGFEQSENAFECRESGKVPIGLNVCNSSGSTYLDLSSGFDRSQQIYSAGAVVRGMGASFGFGWGHATDNLPTDFDNDRTWIDLGAGYASGPWSASLGASLLWDEEGRGSGGGELIQGEAVAISGSFNYILAPGLSIGGGVTVHDITNGMFQACTNTTKCSKASKSIVFDGNDATVVSISTLMNF